MQEKQSTLRADNKVMPCHTNSWSGLIQRR